jgi:hypothetical protein
VVAEHSLFLAAALAVPLWAFYPIFPASAQVSRGLGEAVTLDQSRDRSYVETWLQGRISGLRFVWQAEFWKLHVAIDVAFILDLILCFFKPFEDRMGKFITNPNQIAWRYATVSRVSRTEQSRNGLSD